MFPNTSFILAPAGLGSPMLRGKLVRNDYPRTCTHDREPGIDERCSAGVHVNGELYCAFPCARHHAEWQERVKG